MCWRKKAEGECGLGDHSLFFEILARVFYRNAAGHPAIRVPTIVRPEASNEALRLFFLSNLKARKIILPYDCLSTPLHKKRPIKQPKNAYSRNSCDKEIYYDIISPIL